MTFRFDQLAKKSRYNPSDRRRGRGVQLSRFILAMVIAVCFANGRAFAAVTIDGSSQQFGAVGSTALSFLHPLGTGTNRLVVCNVQIANPTTAVANVMPTVTLAGFPMTAIPASQSPSTAQSNTSKIESEMFFINDTALGTTSGNVAVSVSLPSAPTGGIECSCTSFFGLAQNAPETAGTAYSGNNLAQPLALTAATAGDLIVDSFAGGFNLNSTGKSASPIAGQTQLTNAQLVAGGILSGSSYQVVPAPGPVTAEWSPVNVSRLAYSAAVFAPAAATDYTVTTAVNPAGAGTVTLSPSQTSYIGGTTVTVTAASTPGYFFTGFSGDLTGTTNPATLVIDGNKSITANFAVASGMCALTTTAIGQGTVAPASGSYPCGSTINLVATPASGYSFSQWSGTAYSGTSSSTTFTLSQDTTETATFVQAPVLCTLTTSVTGAGIITPVSGSYPCGTQLTLSAVPAASNLFDSWGGALSGSSTPATLTLNTDATVTAKFVHNSSGVTGDPRTVTEPVYPAVCSVLSAQQVSSGLIESSPDTARVQAALNACTPGQAVEFSSSGVYDSFLIAPITLPAGVTMLVDPDVTIYGSISYADYSCDTSASWCTPLINVAANADPAPGSGIMGLGVIDGRGGVTLTDKGKSWWATGSDARPRLIFLGNRSTNAPADNFTMYQITLRNSPKFHVSGIGNNLTVWRVRIYSPPDSPNTDGIDPSGSKDITITKSYISDGDDMIAPKAGVGHVSNITISDNHFYSGHGISVGSETNAGLNNMYVHDNAFDNAFGGTSFDSIRIKSDTSRGGEVYDVLYKNTCILHGGDTLVFDPYYSSATGNLIPNFHDITISNLHQLIRDSSHKSTLQGYNTSGIIYPLVLTLDNVSFDGATLNDFKAPAQVNNAQITLGPGPVNIASFLITDAATASNYITVTNNVSNNDVPLDCSAAFVYLTGDLTAARNTATAGDSFTVTAMLQNVVSPPVSGTIAYPQQNMPTGTIQLMEGTNVVAQATIANGTRLTNLTIPSITAGIHTYTANYLGDTNYTTPFSFGTYTVNVSVAAPMANDQSVNVPSNTATPVTLTATGTGTLAYTVVANPTHGTLSGTAPNLTYTPASGYAGPDSFTFKANNGTDSNVATVSITVLNAPPVAINQAVSVPFNTATTVTLSASGAGTLVYTVLAGPAHGTLSGTAPNLTYTPAAGYAGADSFTFKANNGTDSNVATVSITVLNAPPVAANQSVVTAFNTAIPVTLSASGVGPLVYTVVAGPAHGTLSGTAPNLTYTPGAGYAGPDSFTFKANNGTDSNVATVSITINPGLIWSTAGPLTETISNGQIASFNLQLSGWIGETGPVTFSCAGAPPSAACTVSAPLTLNGANQIPVVVSLEAKNAADLPASASDQASGFHGAPGTYPLTVIASTGGVSKAISLIVIVR